MKSDNEPTISLPVCQKKWKYVCEKNKKQKQKDPKKRKKKSFLSARVEPGPTDVEGIRVIYNATTNIEHPR